MEGVKLDAVSSAAVHKGHDRYFAGSHLMAVVDGATPLRSEWPQNVGEFASTVVECLKDSCYDEAIEMAEAWRLAIRCVRQKFGDIQPYLSAGVALARVRRGVVELSVVGDCGIVIKVASGEVIQVHDIKLSEMDAAAKSTGTAATIAASLLRNRMRMNSPSGYWIFSTDDKVADHIRVVRLKIQDVRDLLLYSDGLYRLVEPYGFFDSPEELLDGAARDGVEHLLKILRNLEQDGIVKDPSRSVLDAPDDATGILVRFPLTR